MSRFNGVAYAGQSKVALTHTNFRGMCEAELCAEFVAWMRSEDGHGWWAASELDTILDHYCMERGLTPPPKARARNLMLQVPGVYRKRHHLNGPAFARVAKATGLTRAVIYWIPPSAEAVNGPWASGGLESGSARPVADTGRTVADTTQPVADTGRIEAGQCPQRDFCEDSIR